MRPAIQHGKHFAETVAALKRMKIGGLATFSGFIIRREGNDTFHLQHAGEAILGSADSVLDWIGQLKRTPSL